MLAIDCLTYCSWYPRHFSHGVCYSLLLHYLWACPVGSNIQALPTGCEPVMVTWIVYVKFLCSKAVIIVPALPNCLSGKIDFWRNSRYNFRAAVSAFVRDRNSFGLFNVFVRRLLRLRVKKQTNERLLRMISWRWTEDACIMISKPW